MGHPDEETFLASLEELTGFLDGFLREHGLRWEQTVIGGFSQGAGMSYSVALGTGRPRVAGILGMSGFLPTVRGWRLDIHAKKGLSAFITHGAFDPVIPVGFGRRARDLLQEGGLYVTYEETRVQHQIDPELLPAMRDWVSARTGGEGPLGDVPQSEV